MPKSEIPKMKKETIELFVFIMILLFTLMLRLDVIENDRDFWHDESFQFLYSRETPTSEILLGSTDVHPPLYNILMKPITTITAEPKILRFSSVVFALMTLLCLFLFCQEFFGFKVASISGILFAILPTWLYYGTEFRVYSFLVMVGVINLYFFYKMVSAKFVGKSFAIIYIITSLILIYTHYFAVLFLTAQWFWYSTMFRYRKSVDKINPFSVIWAIGVMSIPLAVYMLKTIPKIHAFWFEDITLWSLVSTFSHYFTLPEIYPSLFLIIFYGILIYALVVFKNHITDLHKLLLTVAIFPVIVAFAISQFVPAYHHRYFLLGGIFILPLVGWAQQKFSNAMPRIYGNKRISVIFNFVFMFFLFMVALDSLDMVNGTANHEIQESVKAVINDTEWLLPSGITTIIHHSSFSQTPYQFYLYGTEFENYFVTNQTEKQRFTAGGSVIDSWEIINKTELERNNYAVVLPYYEVSHIRSEGQIIFEEGGLYVTKHE